MFTSSYLETREARSVDVSDIVSRIFKERREFDDFRIYSDKISYFIDLDVPGFTRDDLEIVVSNGKITISGSCKLRQDEKRNMNRSFTIAKTTDPDKIEAVVENGILNIMLPRVAEKQDSATKVEIK